jgi:hypothetical protein
MIENLLWLAYDIIYALKTAPIWLSTPRFQEPIAVWFSILFFLIVVGLVVKSSENL